MIDQKCELGYGQRKTHRWTLLIVKSLSRLKMEINLIKENS